MMTAPNRARVIQGECHDPATGEMYAVSIAVSTASPAKLPDTGVAAAAFTISASPAVAGTVTIKPMGREPAWDGAHRV